MLKIKDLNVKLGKNQILKDVSFELEPNKITALVGLNGVGKSTIVACINQIYKYSGIIMLNNIDIKNIKRNDLAKEIAILPQIKTYPHMTVSNLVGLGRNPYLDFFGRKQRIDEEIIQNAIELIGINNLKDKYIDELSGGEKQKSYLAMMIAQDTNILVLDEPTTFMDMNYEYAFLETLKKLTNKTILVVMHNLNQAVNYADNIIIINNGMISFDGPMLKCLEEAQIEKNFDLVKYTSNGKIFFGK